MKTLALLLALGVVGVAYAQEPPTPPPIPERPTSPPIRERPPARVLTESMKCRVVIKVGTREVKQIHCKR